MNGNERRDYELSLKEIAGSEIVDVFGYNTQEFGEQVFKISRIILADGRVLAVEGEHDFPYIADPLK